MALKFVETIKRVTDNGDQIIINMDGYTTFKGLVAVMHDVARAIKKYDAGFARDLARVRTIADAKSYLQPYLSGVEQWYIFEVEDVPCASRMDEETDEMEYSDGANYFHIYFLIDNPDYKPASDDGQETTTAAQEGQEGNEGMNITVGDLLEMMDLRTIDEIKMYCADGYDLGSMEIETAMDTEYYGARAVKRFGFKHDEIAEFNILVITLADTWHRDGTPEGCEFWEGVNAQKDGDYMVKCYTRAGNLAATYYADDEKTAAKIRVEHAASLGVYPGDREHWALFPTIWKKDAGGEFHRMTKYA